METLSEEMLAAIGRMTVAAADLEQLLAWIGGDRTGEVFARPGESLAAARAAAEPEDLARAVEAAGTQLMLSRSELSRLWLRDTPPEAAVFDDRALLLARCRSWLAGIVADASEASGSPERHPALK